MTLALPRAQVRVWPPGSPDGTPVVIPIYSGSSAVDYLDVTASFDFDVPSDFDYAPQDYNLPAGFYLESGAWIELLTSLDGEFNGSQVKKWFYGRIREYTTERQFTGDGRPLTNGRYKALDPLAIKRGTAVNRDWSTRMKVYETTFTSSDFDGSDPHFLVNIPDNSEDWVEGGIISLSGFDTTAGDDDESNLIDYGKDEFAYSASNKQLYFKSSQEYPRFPTVPKPGSPQSDWQWTIRLYYYDPTDTDHTVTALLVDIYTGDPLSVDGGLGFDSGALDFEEIYGFDGVTPKRIRSFTWIKTEGPVSALEDKLRQDGLIPSDYRIAYDPSDRTVKGRNLIQDNGSAAVPGGVLSERSPYTIDGLALRVECHSPAVTPPNYALAADVTTSIPADYFSVPSDSDTAAANIHDGQPGTFLQWQRGVNTLNYSVHATADNAIVLDLHASRLVGEVNFRGSSPQKEKGGGKFAPIKIFIVTRKPKVTVSLTDDPTDTVGVPVSVDAIAAGYDPMNVDDYADLKFQATLRRKGRYVIIRWDQDFFGRNDNNPFPPTHRISDYPISEIRVLGDGLFRYLDDDLDAGAVPYAQLTNKGGTITGIATLMLTVGTGHNFEDGDHVQFWDTSADQPFPFDATQTVTAHTSTTITVSGKPVALANTDMVGSRKRWMKGLPGDWVDLLAKKRFAKLHDGGGDWLEIIDKETPGSIEEAEELCVERLLTLSRISRDHELEIPLSHTLDIGSTIRPYGMKDSAGNYVRPPFLATRHELNLKPFSNDPNEPPLTLTLSGTNYEEDYE